MPRYHQAFPAVPILKGHQVAVHATLYGPREDNGRRRVAPINLLIGTTITHIALR